jgi:hypothetical protein
MTTVSPSASPYPVHVEAKLDPQLNRWLWLVKWLLALPHYVLLAFLWLAFFVVSVAAFFSILVTGRYPRVLFDFNLGVLRWTWRVTYYAYGALGTDKYPPFSLAEHPEYPARLDVEYPEHLSRGLVLVKWWLLAIPHYLVVALLVGGGLYVATGGAGTDEPVTWGTGLIGLLVFVAAVVLLFTGRYPQSIFDLVLGLNRWVIRVAGYAALMTDRYPPFRLDQGGADPSDPTRPGGPGGPGGLGAPTAGRLDLQAPPDPGTSPSAPAPASAPGSSGTAVAAAPPGTATPPGTTGTTDTTGGGRHPWTAGRVIALVVGSVLLLASLSLATVGAGLAVADNVLRDDDGYLMTGSQSVATDTYAISSTSLDVHTDVPGSELSSDLLGRARIDVSRAGDPVFVGVAPTLAAAAYLRGVEHATLTEGGETPRYRITGSAAPAAPPTEVDFWTDQSTGSGVQSVTWPLEEGSWTVVVMNADGSAGVSADVAAGATAPFLSAAVWFVLGIAALGVVISVVIIALAIWSAQRRSAAPQ